MTVHFLTNPMWATITLCSSDPVGYGTYSWEGVTCEKCLELKSTTNKMKGKNE